MSNNSIYEEYVFRFFNRVTVTLHMCDACAQFPVLGETFLIDYITIPNLNSRLSSLQECLAECGKQLSPDQLQMVASAERTNNSLYLKVVIQVMDFYYIQII